MEKLYAIDNSMDEREFRNYIHSILPKLGYEELKIDDARIADGIKINDNDILATKDEYTYTVQTFLNKKITAKELEECKKDKEKEDVDYGLVITNNKVDKKIKEEAKKDYIIIIDRDNLLELDKKQ